MSAPPRVNPLTDAEPTPVAATARGALGEDRFGLRHEFLRLVDVARDVTTPQTGNGGSAE